MRILYNAHIQTNQPALPNATAVAIERDRFVAAGSDAEILASFGAFSQKVNMQGKTIWPGLTDGHLHLEHYAVSLALIDCETATRAECLRRVAERTAATPAPTAWVRGHGWNQNVWQEGFGNAADLDAVTGEHPAYLTAKSLHAGWANSAALRIAGITSATPDPQDGKIVRDALGNPTGILLESAMGLIQAVIPSLSVQDVAKLLIPAQQNLWQLGITGVHDYDQARCFSALQLLDNTGALRLRVVKSIPYHLLDEAIALGLRSGFGSDFLRIGSVKLFADGALGPHTAAMLQPYEDDSRNTGLLFLDGEQIYESGQKATLGGISMAIHAIGDRANHEVLQAYSQLRDFEKAQAIAPLRHRIEHVQILHPNDYNRLANLNVIASVQPIHATSDMQMADRYWGKRSAGAYAFRTLIENGTRMVFGSDAPVESPNPFWGIHAAVTRRRVDGTPGEDGWYPDQRLPLDLALQGYTTGPAYAAGLENSLGQIAPGFFADLIVLPESPSLIPPQDLHSLRPSAVMVAGEWVLESE
jgi:predicted amidohydrolase YtcJ